jgi:hypothetical protein
MTDGWSDEQTDNPVYADDRNFYKVEAWSRDAMSAYGWSSVADLHINALLYAGK